MISSLLGELSWSELSNHMLIFGSDRVTMPRKFFPEVLLNQFKSKDLSTEVEKNIFNLDVYLEVKNAEELIYCLAYEEIHKSSDLIICSKELVIFLVEKDLGMFQNIFVEELINCIGFHVHEDAPKSIEEVTAELEKRSVEINFQLYKNLRVIRSEELSMDLGEFILAMNEV